MTYSRDNTLLTPAEIEKLREDNRRSGEIIRELFRAEKEGSRDPDENGKATDPGAGGIDETERPKRS